MENVDKKNIGLPSRYINALYELCDEAKNLKKITQDFEKFIKLVEDNKNLNNVLFSPTVGKTNQSTSRFYFSMCPSFIRGLENE